MTHFTYSVRQLRLAADYLEAGNVTLAHDCMRRALDGMGDARHEPEWDGDIVELGTGDVAFVDVDDDFETL